MSVTSVASRYAKALFIVTERRGETAQALEDVKSMAEMIRPGTRVAALLATPQVLLADKRRTLLQVMEGRALRSVTLFVDLLLRKRRLGEFQRIVSEFESLVERQQGIRRAHVVSAVALTAAEQQRLHAELERTTGGRIRLGAEVDPELLGGALVRIGDRVIDRSVRTLLDTIERRLHEMAV